MIVAQDFVILRSNTEPNPSICAAREDERLAADGWVRRHTADADRAKESIELYRSLGFEVLMRELTSTDYDPSCHRDCVASAGPSHVLIYTRKGAGGKLGSNERIAGKA